MSKLTNHPLPVIISIVSGLITIFVFATGEQDIKNLFPKHRKAVDSVHSTTVKAEEKHSVSISNDFFYERYTFSQCKDHVPTREKEYSNFSIGEFKNREYTNHFFKFKVDIPDSYLFNVGFGVSIGKHNLHSHKISLSESPPDTAQKDYSYKIPKDFSAIFFDVKLKGDTSKISFYMGAKKDDRIGNDLKKYFANKRSNPFSDIPPSDLDTNIYQCTIGNRRFSYMNLLIPAPKYGQFNVIDYATIVNGYVLYISFLYNDEKSHKEVLNILKHIKFY